MHIRWTVILFLSKREVWLICIVSLLEWCFKQMIGHTLEWRGKLFAHFSFYFFLFAANSRHSFHLLVFFPPLISNFRHVLNVVCFLLGNSLASEIYKPAFFVPTCLWRWNRQSVPKHWHIKFRRRGINPKKAYNLLSFLYISVPHPLRPHCRL